MNRRRLLGLLGLVTALGVARWLVPVESGPAPDLVAARERKVGMPTGAASAPSRQTTPRVPAASLVTSGPGMEDDPPIGDAFSIRHAPTLPSVVSVPATGAAPTAVAPPPLLPVAPPPVAAANEPVAPVAAASPPMQVIGTWDDGTAPPGVFLALPRGTVLARVGTVLMAEYTVTSLDRLQVTVTNLETRQSFSIPVPATAPRR